MKCVVETKSLNCTYILRDMVRKYNEDIQLMITKISCLYLVLNNK